MTVPSPPERQHPATANKAETTLTSQTTQSSMGDADQQGHEVEWNNVHADATTTIIVGAPVDTEADPNAPSASAAAEQARSAHDEDHRPPGDTQENEGEEDDEFYGGGARGEARRRKLQHWRDSPFAVGCVNVDWKDDRPSWWCIAARNNRSDQAARDIDHTFPVTSVVCGLLGARRVGNFSVLAQTTVTYDESTEDPETDRIAVQQRKRPKLLCVVGPYWTVNTFITFPLILGASGWVFYNRILTVTHIAITVTWSIGTFLLLFSLCMISCRNPGILYRHTQAPPGEEDWRWNDQARTYRPPKARFDPECQAVIIGFDHTCPWTGTVSKISHDDIWCLCRL